MRCARVHFTGSALLTGDAMSIFLSFASIICLATAISLLRLTRTHVKKVDFEISRLLESATPLHRDSIVLDWIKRVIETVNQRTTIFTRYEVVYGNRMSIFVYLVILALALVLVGNFPITVVKMSKALNSSIEADELLEADHKP